MFFTDFLKNEEKIETGGLIDYIFNYNKIQFFNLRCIKCKSLYSAFEYDLNIKYFFNNRSFDMHINYQRMRILVIKFKNIEIISRQNNSCIYGNTTNQNYQNNKCLYKIKLISDKNNILESYSINSENKDFQHHFYIQIDKNDIFKVNMKLQLSIWHFNLNSTTQENIFKHDFKMHHHPFEAYMAKEHIKNNINIKFKAL